MLRREEINPIEIPHDAPSYSHPWCAHQVPNSSVRQSELETTLVYIAPTASGLNVEKRPKR